MITLTSIIKQIADLKEQIKQLPRYEWATVTKTSPLTVVTDTDPTPITGLSKVGNPQEGERCRLERQGTSATVWAGTSSSSQSAGSRITRGTIAERVSITPKYGQLWQDTENGNVWVGSKKGRWRLRTTVVSFPVRGWDFAQSPVWARTDKTTIHHMWLEEGEHVITSTIGAGTGFELSSLIGEINHPEKESLELQWRKIQIGSSVTQPSKYIVHIVGLD